MIIMMIRVMLVILINYHYDDKGNAGDTDHYDDKGNAGDTDQ